MTAKIRLFLTKSHTTLFKTIGFVVVLFISAIGLSGCSGSDEFEVFSNIQGVVTDYQSGVPLVNAVVTLSPSGLSRNTDASGDYKFEGIDAQQYTLTVQKNGYQPNRKIVVAISGETQIVDIQLTAIPQ